MKYAMLFMWAAFVSVQLSAVAMADSSRQEEVKTYGSEKCGFLFESSINFDEETTRCIWSISDEESNLILFFFGGHMFLESNLDVKEYFDDYQGYNNDTRFDLRFLESINSVKRKRIDSLKKSSKDMISVSIVKVKRRLPDCQFEDAGIDCKEIITFGECWNGVFFGKTDGPLVRVRSLCSPYKPGSKFASLDSWQARLIKSLTLTFPEDPNAVPSPGFDCDKARTKVEETICADKSLSALDWTLTSRYDNLKINISDANRKRLLEDQRTWIKQRNNCQTSECLHESYTRRISEVCTKYPVISGVSICTAEGKE